MVESILSGDLEYAKELEQDPLYDEELGDDVDYCVDWVTSNLPSSSGEGVCELELRLESSLIDGFGGTMDVLRIVGPNAYIVDFKFGSQTVEADQNTQLLCYALLVYEHYPEIETFTVTILQGGEAKQVVLCRSQLDEFFQVVLRATLETYYEAGEHCLYCPLRYRCGTAAAYIFETVHEVELPDDPLPSPDQVDQVVNVAKAAKLGKDIYDLAGKVLKKWHTDGIHLGDEAKVTESKRRSWNDHAEAVLTEDLGESAFTRKLKTVAQIEKINPNGDYENLIDTTPTKVLRLGKLPPEFD